jgi:tetratricopeptide (TPR) repeat protein
VRLYAEAAQKAPGIPFIWDNLGTMLAENGNREGAVQAFIHALQASPEDQIALESLVQLKAAVKLLRDPKDPKSAVVVPVENFKQMAQGQIEPLSKNPQQLVQFGETMLREGVIPDVGVQALEKARELLPDDPRTLAALGAGYRMLGKLEESKAAIIRYTELKPQDAFGFFNLAQTCNAANDAAGERAALGKALEVDPNIQQALGIYFELKNEADPVKEEALVKFAEERNAWMPLLLASSMARDRGDVPQAVAYVQKAYDRNARAEEVLLQYCAMLGDSGDAEALDLHIQPAVTTGRYSKRLDWNYAQSLRQVGKGALAIEVLRRAQLNEAPDDFKAAAENAIEAWTGLRIQGGAGLEVHNSGQLLRPVLVALEDGDGGIVLNPRQALPAHGKFPWRAKDNGGTEARVRLQQGQSGVGQPPRPLGVFIAKGIAPAADGSAPAIECRVEADAQGRLYFAAGQAGRKLPVEWAEA